MTKTLTEVISEEVKSYHGCLSGDCPHEKQSECYDAVIRHSVDAAIAHVSKELDEDGTGPLAQWKRQYINEWGKTKQLEKELAAAKERIANEIRVTEAFRRDTRAREDIFVAKIAELEKQVGFLVSCARSGEYLPDNWKDKLK